MTSKASTPAFRAGYRTALAVYSLFLLAAPAELVRAEGADSGDPVSFGFDVEDGEVWIKSIETHNSRDYKDRAPYLETRVRSEIRLRFEKGTQGSATVVLEPLFAETEVNGMVQENPAQQIAVGHSTRLHLDDQGKAVAGDGYSQLMRKFERELDAQSFASVRGRLSAEAMKNGEIAEWNRPLEGMRGSQVRIGDQWRVLAEKLVRDKFIPLSGALTFEGWTELDGMRALRVSLSYDSSGELYSSVDSTATRTLNLRPPDRAQYGRHNLVVKGTTTWLIAPERGMPLYETHEETMAVPFSLDDPTQTAEVRESHVYRFRPEKGGDGS